VIVFVLTILPACGSRASNPASQPQKAPVAKSSNDACLLFGSGYAMTLDPLPGWRVLCGDEAPPDRHEIALMLPVGADENDVQPPFMYVVVENKYPDEDIDTFIAAENRSIVESFESVEEALESLRPPVFEACRLRALFFVQRLDRTVTLLSRA